MQNLEKKIDKVRNILKKYVEQGGDVNNLSKRDSEYIAVCNLFLPDKNGKNMSLTEKFKFLGFERKAQREPFFEKAKKLVDKYIAQGGEIDELNPGHEVYDYIASNTIKKADGTNMSLTEKFEKLGYLRLSKHKKSFVKAKKMLDDYVACGGNVDDLKTSHPIYEYICFSQIYSNDDVLLKTMEEKFEALGHPRKRKIAKDVKETLIKEIDEYIAKGGSFDVERTALPFFGRMRTYIRSRYHTKGDNISFEQAMKDLGYGNYSDICNRCKELEKLKSFRDEEGYVDSYRQDKLYSGYITYLSKTLDLPYSIIIQLLCDEKLKTITISTEYVAYVKAELEKFIEANGSLKGFSRDKVLYEKFHNLRRYISAGTGENLTSEEILQILDLEVEHRLKNEQLSHASIEEHMKKFAGKKKVKSTDMDSSTYRQLLNHAIKLSIPLAELFKSYGISYSGKNRDRISTVKVQKMPYLKEMKTRRDNLLKKSEIKKENGFSKEEIFEERIRICRRVYDEFKDKIYNFIPDDVKEKE